MTAKAHATTETRAGKSRQSKSAPPFSAHERAPAVHPRLPSRSNLPLHPASIPTHPRRGDAPRVVYEALRSPSQPLDTATRAFMEPRFGRDLSHVRIHTGPQAEASARAIDALAFTAGNRIVFASGRYDPHTVSGRRLLTHELAHVVQQSGRSVEQGQPWCVGSARCAAEQAADAAVDALEQMPRMPSATLAFQLSVSASTQPILRRVTTWGGEWTTTRYNSLPTNDGVDIELHFKPGDPVDASSIGIIQKVTSRQNGALVAVNPTVGARSIPAGSPGEGAHIDQLAQFRNPLFATGAGGANDKLWDTPTGAQWGQHGFRHVDAKGVVNHKDAILIDRPTLPGAGANSSQIFEDTAMAITGVQTGANYGSVQWGWRIDGAGVFSRLPLSKVSDTVPSQSFKRAQGLWNTNQDSAGNALIRFYSASQKFVQADDTSLVSNPAEAAKTELAKLAKNTRIEVVNIGFWEKFNAPPAAVKWWKVTVTDGPSNGQTGWIQSNQLGNAKVVEAPVAP